MNASQKLLWNLYAGAIGALTAIVAQKAVSSAWRLATGDEPPEAGDPATPLSEALTWALASGIGIGIAQLLMNRVAANRWEAVMGTPAPNAKPITLKI